MLGNNNDVILCKPLHEKIPVAVRMEVAAGMEDLALLFSSVKRVAPDYYQSVLSFFSKNKVIPYNMFVMRKKDFNRFAEWQFRILFDMEKYVLLSSYTRAKRVFAYYGEMLLPIYCMHNNMKIKYDYVIDRPRKIISSRRLIRKLKDLYIKIGFVSPARRNEAPVCCTAVENVI